ncbi:DUF3017 domain-containing protein [Kitasatospora camelliae]|uniref:DUF3017 domain-containing protein n=1 Tax=Kitasatospora camelliae TaxID=3156397 RepID=A0AAU8JUL5_9ACTN
MSGTKAAGTTPDGTTPDGSEPAAAGAGGTTPAGTTPAGVKPGRVRRRQVRTTGTLPPEGSAPVLDGSHPLPVRQWPITLVLAIAGLGLVITWLGDFRIGLLTVGAAALLAALLRLVLPEVGMLAVRSRFTDVSVLLVLGVVITVLTLVAQPDPWLRLPLLDNLGRLIGRPSH